MPASRSAVPFVFATVLLDAMGFGIVLPILPSLVQAVAHVGLAEATRIGGWLGLAYAAMQFLCGPLIGNLGDRFGRRPVILAAMAGYAIDYLLMGFAPTIGWLILGRAIAGICGASWTPAFAAIADISTPEQRAKRFGLISAAFSVGFIAGPALGGLLGEFGPRAPFWMAASLSGINFLFGLILFPETLATDRRRPFRLARANPLGALKALRRLPGLLPLSLVYFFWCVATLVYPTTWAYYASLKFGWGPGVIGATLAWTGSCMVLVQTLLLGRVVQRLGDSGTALFGMAVAVVVFVSYAVIPQAWMLWVVLTVSALHAMAQPTIQATMSHRVPPDAQGELQGFNGSIMALAALLGPLVLNLPLAWATGPGAPFYFPGMAFVIAAGFAGVAGMLLFVWRRRHPTAVDAATAPVDVAPVIAGEATQPV